MIDNVRSVRKHEAEQGEEPDLVHLEQDGLDNVAADELKIRVAAAKDGEDEPGLRQGRK